MDQTLRAHTFPSGQRVEVAQGDITAETTDSIVNAANRYLEHGSGVAGTIVRRGGPQIQAESSRWVHEHGLVTHSKPAYTLAGNLPCRYVIHAVGPVWSEGDEETKLADAIRGSLCLADQLDLRSIAFPAISTGIYRFPVTLAAQVILSSISGYLADNPTSRLELIRLVLYDHDTWQTFADALEQDDHLSA
jgi:O-acetyl-ADP-ribose deacetylase (regulator of RNase III)